MFEKYIKDYIDQFCQSNRKFWNYEDGCVLIGAQNLFEATGEQIYLDCISNFYASYIKADGTILYYEKKEYSLDKVPLARPLLFIYQRTGESRYLKAAERIAQQLREQPQTQSGNYWHKGIYPHQVWLDGLYMAQPFCVAYENDFGTLGGYDRIIQQLRSVRELLFDGEKQLYYHCYDETKSIFWANKKTGRSANFWSRAIGWHIMALLDCYDLLPSPMESQRSILAELFIEATTGLLPYRDKQVGLLYQLTALPEEPANYLETSASIMLAYILLKGSRLGLLEEKFQEEGKKILQAVGDYKMKQVNGALSLIDICPGTGLGPECNVRRDGSVSYYLSDPTVSNEQKGVGALMMAFAELLKSKSE